MRKAVDWLGGPAGPVIAAGLAVAMAADPHGWSRGLLAAGVVAASLSSEIVWHHLTREVLTDALTGLWNRRSLEGRLEEEVARASRAGAPLVAVMLDLDGFRDYNNKWGHLAGDRVLQTVSGAIGRILRRSDVAFRYGGEEFVLLMPGTEKAGAECAVQRLRAMDLPVTSSAGIAEYPEEAGGPQTLLGLADWRLIEAKHAGKDRVCADGFPANWHATAWWAEQASGRGAREGDQVE